MDNACFTCDVVNEYVTLANAFTQDLSEVLVDPMWVIFLSLAGLWVTIHGIKMILGKADLLSLAHEFVFVVIAATLMAGQGPTLVNQVYSTSLSVMGGAAGAVLSTASISEKTGVSSADAEVAPGASGISNVDGMQKLVWVAETGVKKVFALATEVMAESSLTNPGPILYAILLALPYVLLLVVYFAQVVVSIFRVMMFAALSPILMMLLAFGWGRGMAMTGIKTLFASFMVLFGATVALAVCLYGVKALAVADYDASTPTDVLSLTSSTLWVAMILGWLGTAFMAEATGMANSIAGSQLTNQAAAVITAGVTASAVAAHTKGFGMLNKLTELTGTGRNAFTNGLGDSGGLGSQLSPAGQAMMDRIKTPTFDRGTSK
ncbi:type IV secretion system protein [Tepidicaulis sp. LMO-SS28]|uniref:type IV secretion system protein n=1 Tax=Tepidicaulis sp. LMO-SS28 TaxID=3447455 RepID=UPI003EE1BAC2